jgi:hypothetical protein
MKMIFVTLFLFSMSAMADIPAELRCTNFKGERLDWQFTVIQLAENGKPGVIQGPVSLLRIKKKNGAFEEIQELFKSEESSPFSSEEGYNSITVSPSSITTGIDNLKVNLDGELWDNLSNVDPNAKDKIYMDTAQIVLSHPNGDVFKTNFICAMVLTK